MSEALARVLTQEGINEAQKSTSTLRRLTLRPKDDSPENNKKKCKARFIRSLVQSAQTLTSVRRKTLTKDTGNTKNDEQV